MVFVYDASLASEAVYECLLRPIDVGSPRCFVPASCAGVSYTKSVFSREGLDGMQTRIKIGLVAVGVTYVITILSILLGCHPMHKNWQINPDPGSTRSLISSHRMEKQLD